MNYVFSRNIIQTSSSTKGINLPVIWLRAKNLDKGDGVKVIATEKALIILKQDNNIQSILKAFGIENVEELKED